MKLHIDGKKATYVAIEASKRDPIRVEAVEDGVATDRTPVHKCPWSRPQMVASHPRAFASHRPTVTAA